MAQSPLNADSYDSLDSGQQFWTTVLLLAIRDYATSVQFRPSLGVDCLSLTVAEVDYSLVPPDPGLRHSLLRVARNLCAGSAWKGLLWSWKASVLRCSSSGLVTLVCGGIPVQWTGIFGREGTVFKRKFQPNDYDGAIACYTGHIQRNPEYAEAYGARGWAYLMTGDFDSAITDCTAAVGLDPRGAANYYNRSRAYREKGDTAKSEADFAQAKKLGYKEK